jgi:hypothetical protein
MGAGTARVQVRLSKTQSWLTTTVTSGTFGSKYLLCKMCFLVAASTHLRQPVTASDHLSISGHPRPARHRVAGPEAGILDRLPDEIAATRELLQPVVPAAKAASASVVSDVVREG